MVQEVNFRIYDNKGTAKKSGETKTLKHD